MGKHEKLLRRLEAKPKDFTWDELTTLRGLGYTEATGGKTGGSRRRFLHDRAPDIFLHKPHPGSVLNADVLKAYVVRLVLETLREGGLI